MAKALITAKKIIAEDADVDLLPEDDDFAREDVQAPMSQSFQAQAETRPFGMFGDPELDNPPKVTYIPPCEPCEPAPSCAKVEEPVRNIDTFGDEEEPQPKRPFASFGPQTQTSERPLGEFGSSEADVKRPFGYYAPQEASGPTPSHGAYATSEAFGERVPAMLSSAIQKTPGALFEGGKKAYELAQQAREKYLQYQANQKISQNTQLKAQLDEMSRLDEYATHLAKAKALQEKLEAPTARKVEEEAAKIEKNRAGTSLGRFAP